MATSTDINTKSDFQLGDWLVHPSSGRISKNGREVKLEPKVMEVLVFLAEQAGEVVSREALEARAWAGMVVGYDAVSGSIIKLRKALGDDRSNPGYIETISKKGYRLIAPVSSMPESASQHTADIAGESPHTSVNSRPAVNSRLKIAVAVGMGTVCVIVALVFLLGGPIETVQRPSKVTEKPAVLVLPFENLSDDARQEYLSDGITDDLITDLSKQTALKVLARQSSYHYKNNPVDIGKISSQLGVTYIIEGSIRRSGESIRINVQLTHAEKGESIWAERFDTSTRNIFEIQDKLTQNVITAMSISLSGGEPKGVGTRGTHFFDAYDAFLQGQKQIRKRSKQGYDLAMEAFRKAIQIDQHYGRAYGAMAVTLTRGYRYQWSDISPVEAREHSLELAKRAIELDSSSPQVYWSLGYVRLHRREYDEAGAAARQSITISPNYADGYALLANIANWRGKATDAADNIKKAIALNPHYTFQYPSTLGLAYLQLGEFEQARALFRDALVRNENALNPRLFLTVTYVKMGLMDEAAWEIEQISTNHPHATLSSLGIKLPFERTENIQFILDALRVAGLPE